MCKGSPRVLGDEDEDDSDDGISDTDDEVTDIVEPVSIVHPTEGKCL